MKESRYLMTKIESYNSQTDEAYCKVRYKEGIWLPVIISKQSLISLDLREGETFKWNPQEDGMQEDGIVRQEHIREHPRRADPGEDERTRNAFENLEAFMRSKGSH